MDSGIYYQVKQVMDGYKIPEWIWRPIMTLESSGRPDAANITARETSYGLFQINTKAHPEYAALNLQDPAVNARVIAELWSSRGVIEKALALPAERQAAYVWRYGSRPAWSPALDERVTKLSLNVIGGQQKEGKIVPDYFSDALQYFQNKERERITSEYLEPGDSIPKLGLTGIIARGGVYGLILVMIFISLILLFTPGTLKELKKGAVEI
jgi:hypothetical protein